MRALYVLRYYPALTETFVARELAGLAARGLHVEVASLGERADAALVEPVPGVPVHRVPRGLATLRTVPDALLRHHPALAELRRWQGAKAAARAAHLAGVAARNGITRIHAHFAGEAAEVARAVAALLEVPFSVTAHAVDLFRPRASLPVLLAEARPAITVCAHHRDWIRAHYDVDAIIVRCGVSLDVPRAEPASRGPLRLISVARDVPKKGLDRLFDALDALPEARLHLVSDSARRHPRAHVGPLPPAAIPGALAAAHAFVLPCRRAADGDLDGIPVALLEALAARLPVVTTAVSGIPELVDAGVGWVVPPDDPAALLAALREAQARPAERARRGARGPARLGDRTHLVDDQVQGVIDAWHGSPDR